MRVEIQDVSLSEEREIVTAMILSDRFLRDVQTFFRGDLFQGRHLRKVAGWCLSYFERYQKAPGADVSSIFEAEVRSGACTEEDAELIAEVLARLSREWEEEGPDEFNDEYLLDKAEIYFKRRALEVLADEIKGTLAGAAGPTGEEAGWQEAEKLVLDFRPVERPKTEGVNPLVDKEILREAFESEEEVVFRLPGDLGKALGPFTRDSFAAIMAPEKRGKTWWLIELAMRAVRQRRRVAFFSVGDMSMGQMTLRLSSYVAKRHWKRRYCRQGVLIPVVDCKWNQLDVCDFPERVCDVGVATDKDRPGELISFEEAQDIEYIPCTACRGKEDWTPWKVGADSFNEQWEGAVWWKELDEREPLTWEEALRYGRKFAKKYGKKSFKLACYPNNSISVRGIRNTLDRWEKLHGFVPDVIVIDYADILAPIDPRKEFRHQQNETWQELRALSQELHCVVLTATQADAQSYSARNLQEKHFSEDKRKYGHVNKGIITLNQDLGDRRRGIMRIGQMFVREDDFDPRRTVTVLQGLSIGRPYLDSFIGGE